jgi:NAD(P)-dependent dehydrogenase (short-subunit alcohol dehydrogenase family)
LAVEGDIVSWTLINMPDLTGRAALVTGANSGLGLQTALGLSRAGAVVTLACRNVDKAEVARQRIVREVPGSRPRVLQLDLADLESVRDAAETLLAEGGALDILVNNAGLMAVDEARTAQGFEMQYGVNHLGHFALTGRLLPMLEQAPAGRVVNVASMGHRAARGLPNPRLERPYDRWGSYFHSKLDNLLFTAALQRRLVDAGSSITAVAAHPGGSRTDLGTEGSGMTNRVMRLAVPLVTQPADAGARPMLRAATDAGLPGGSFVGPRFVVRGRAPVVETPSRRARDAAAAQRLWQESVEQSGVDPSAALRRTP